MSYSEAFKDALWALHKERGGGYIPVKDVEERARVRRMPPPVAPRRAMPAPVAPRTLPPPVRPLPPPVRPLS